MSKDGLYFLHRLSAKEKESRVYFLYGKECMFLEIVENFEGGVTDWQENYQKSMVTFF